MGCNSSQVIFSEEYEKQSEGSTSIYRSPHTILKGGFVNSPEPGILTLQDVLNNSLKKAGDKPFLFSRNKSTGVYEGKSFRNIYETSKKLGSGLINLGLVAEVEGYSKEICPSLSIIGVFSKNREEWLMLEYANIHYGFTMVPFYDTLGLDTIPYVFNHTQLTTVFCSAENAATLAQMGEKTTLRNIVLLDEITQQVRDSLSQYKIYRFQDVVESGEKNLHNQRIYDANLVHTFSYTSGTTGMPKAVMQTHKNYVALLATVDYSDIHLNENDVYLSYLPLPHVFERLMTICCLFCRVSIYFYGGDIMQLKKDLADVKPTIFSSVPRLYNKFYSATKEGLDKLTGVKKAIVARALEVKQANSKKLALNTHFIYDSLVFNKIKTAFGGRVRLMITGSAPISEDVLSFLRIAACCPIFEGYAQTETCGSGFLTSLVDPTMGHVGGPSLNNEFKIIDIPEMNYTTKDMDEKGRLMPRDELLIRGPTVMTGYYKDPVRTKEVLDENGWVHTGDVVVPLPNGAIKIIDRKKNIFKLSQGEYISPEKIENIYVRAKGVAEAFVYGDSLQSALVGVIVPVKEYVEELAKKLGLTGTYEQLCKEKQIIENIHKNIEEIGKAEKLNGLERVKIIYLEPVSFVITGCCTKTFKIKRHESKIYYRGVIDALYKQIS